MSPKVSVSYVVLGRQGLGFMIIVCGRRKCVCGGAGGSGHVVGVGRQQPGCPHPCRGVPRPYRALDGLEGGNLARPTFYPFMF